MQNPATHPLVVALEAAVEQDDQIVFEKNVAAALEAGMLDKVDTPIMDRDQTLMHQVCMHRSKHQAAWVRMLLAHGSDAKLADADGDNTPVANLRAGLF